MRALNPNERKLVVIFGSALFLILNIVLAKWFIAQTHGVQSRIAELQSTEQGYQVVFSDKSRWEARKSWIQSIPMLSHDGPGTDSQFAEKMQQSITQFGLSIESQQLHESENQGDIVTVSLDLTIKGKLEPIVRWMHEVQQPGKYFVIRAFTLKRFDEGANMSARMNVCGLFHRGNLPSAP